VHIYLSPHNDDVCFSLAHHASLTGGAMIVAFPVSNYAPGAAGLPAAGEARVAAVTALRRAEDLRFAAAAGLAFYELSLTDPPVLGLDPFDVAGLKDEADRLSIELAPLLSRLMAEDSTGTRTQLYCPMGIGGHRNHLAMLTVVRRLADTLAPRCDLLLYEDLHYASVAAARRRGIERALRVFAGFAAAPQVEELDEAAAARKLEWIGFYASQHLRPPALADFTPASGLSDRPHEIVWRMTPPHPL